MPQVYVPKLNSESLSLLHTGHLLHTYSRSVPEHPWRHFDVSRCLSHSERISAEDQEMQDDLKEPSNLEELRHSFQRAMDKLVKDIELTLQETQNNDNKRHRKQQQVKMVCRKYSSSRRKTTTNHGGCRSARKSSAKECEDHEKFEFLLREKELQ